MVRRVQGVSVRNDGKVDEDDSNVYGKRRVPRWVNLGEFLLELGWGLPKGLGLESKMWNQENVGKLVNRLVKSRFFLGGFHI